jgi:predicted molibdopterin-dependent oxidoreductase YjgC
MTGAPGPELRTALAGERGARCAVVVDGREVAAHEGESVAAVLIAAGHRAFRRTDRAGEARSYFCGMGVCHDCLVVVDGDPNVRACMTRVRAGMRVETPPGLGLGEAP